MHVAIATALVIPALTMLLDGCATFRIASAITARHAACYMHEHNPDQVADALAQAYKLSGLIRAKPYIDGILPRGERYELSCRLHNFLTALVVKDQVLARDIVDLTSMMRIDLTKTVPYDKVKDIRYMVDAFIDAAERGLGCEDKKSESP